MLNIKAHKLIVESQKEQKIIKTTIKITTCRNNHIWGCYQLDTVLTGSDQSGENLGRTKVEEWERQGYIHALFK